MTKAGNKRVKYDLFEWTEARQKAFENLKQMFIRAPVLAYYDPTLET